MTKSTKTTTEVQNKLNAELNEMLLEVLLREKVSLVKETARKLTILGLIEKAPWTTLERKLLLGRLIESVSPSETEAKIDRAAFNDWYFEQPIDGRCKRWPY